MPKWDSILCGGAFPLFQNKKLPCMRQDHTVRGCVNFDFLLFRENQLGHYLFSNMFFKVTERYKDPQLTCFT